MARIIKWNDEQQKGWDEWVASRPKIIRDLCRRFPPYNLYYLKDPGQKVTISSYFSNGTLKVNVTGEYNAVMFDRQVFGIKPDDLEECDLPDASKFVGICLTEEEDVEEFIDMVRPVILADREKKS